MVSIVHHPGKSKQKLKAALRSQELIQKPWKDVTYWLALHGLFTLPSFAIQSHKPRNGRAHSELEPLIIIIDKIK